jgi:DNA-binding response OmpR family regulator
MNDIPPLALVVEDDPAINQLLVTILRLHGYRAMSALDGDAALALLGSVRPQLMTLDLNMPGMSGAAILRLLRANPDTAALPVIVVSACAQVEPAVAADVQAVVVKPFDLGELLAVIHSVVAAAPQTALQLGA